MIDLFNGEIHSLLPPNFKNDNEIKAVCYAMDKLLEHFYQRVERTLIWSNINVIDDELADYLAAELRTPFYDALLPIETKRTMVANTLLWYSKLGTREVIEEIIALVFGAGEVEEWFEYGGNPYCFKIRLNNFFASQEEYNNFIHALFWVKNTRSWLEKISTYREEQTNLYIGAVSKHMRKYAYTIPSPKQYKANTYIGTVCKHIRGYAFSMSLHKHFNNVSAYSGCVVKHVRRYSWPVKEVVS